MAERIWWKDNQNGSVGVGPTYGEYSFNGRPVRGKTFKNFKEIKDTFWPNVPLEELLPEKTDEEIQDDLKRIIESARRNSRRVSSKKYPR